MSLPVVPRRRENIETHLMPDGSALLYDPALGRSHVLNVIGSFIWEYCDGSLTSEQIAEELATLLPQQPGIHTEALQTIAELEAQGLFASSSDMAGREENA